MASTNTSKSYDADLSKTDDLTDMMNRKEFAILTHVTGITKPLDVDYHLKYYSQQLFVSNLINPNTSYNRLHLSHGPGCHAAGTRVLLADGSIVNVEDVKIGDLLMGYDFKPTRVLLLKRGREPGYKIKTHPEEPEYVVNKSHIITLRNEHGDLRDFTVLEWIYAVTTNPSIKSEWRLTRARDWTHTPPGRLPMTIEEKIMLLQNAVNSKCVTEEIRRLAWSMRYTIHDNRIVKDYDREITIESVGDINYFGWMLDRTPLFLGWDFTVLHNTGKCLAPDTPVRLVDPPYIKLLEDVWPGDKLVGDQNNCNVVQSVNYGWGDMWDICEQVTDKFLFSCNTDHIFTVIKNTEIVDIELMDLLVDNRTTKPTAKWPMFSIDDPNNPIYWYATHRGRGLYKGIVIGGNRRFVIGNGIVTHNTLAAISIAENFSAIKANTGNIIVLGFDGTRKAFTNELLKYPALGYITFKERRELIRLTQAANLGFIENKTELKNFKRHIKARIKYQFYGYDMFVNKVWHKADKTALNTMSIGELDEAIKEGKIRVNTKFIAELENSLIIADEIHNTYNSRTVNIRGLTLQWILSSIKCIRFVSLSATPITNNPTEIVHLVNYLISPDRMLAATDHFSQRGEITQDSLDKLAAATRGKISFLQDGATELYPATKLIGEYIDTFGRAVGRDNALPLIKFRTCQVSDIHEKTIQSVQAEVQNLVEEDEEEITKIRADSLMIFDMILPNPQNDELGIYKSDMRGVIQAASIDWKKSNDIAAIRSGGIISGAIWSADKTLGKWSGKYLEMINILKGITNEKVMIYHNLVTGSGVLTIAEILLSNGYITEGMPGPSTRCVICGRVKSMHSDVEDCQFKPARFLVVHGELDRNVVKDRIDRFNSTANNKGHDVMIFIGSYMIRESYDFKDVTHLIVCSIPYNIPTLHQVIGRVVRRNSHVSLPLDKRYVNIYILVSKLSSMPSPDILRWAHKIDIYKTIQRIELAIYKGAIDINTHYDTILKWWEANDKEDKPPNIPRFNPENVIDIPRSLSQVTTATYEGYGYWRAEYTDIMIAVKRLFLDQPVWTADVLWKAVLDMGSVHHNVALYEKKYFDFVMARMTDPTEYTSLDWLIDPQDYHVYKDSTQYKIAYINLEPQPIFMLVKTNDMPDINSYITSLYDYRSRVTIKPAEVREDPVMLINSTTVCNYDFLVKQSIDMQVLYVTRYIEGIYGTPPVKFPSPTDTIIELLTSLRAFVTVKDIIKYKRVIEKLKFDIKDMKSTDIVGYKYGKIVKIYDPAVPIWITLPKEEINIYQDKKENPILVGLQEEVNNPMEGNVCQIKLRTPLKSTKDLRTVERGMVCSSKSKDWIKTMIAKLGISTDLYKVVNMCSLLVIELIRMEITEKDGYKWVYGWWDYAPKHKKE